MSPGGGPEGWGNWPTPATLWRGGGTPLRGEWGLALVEVLLRDQAARVAAVQAGQDVLVDGRVQGPQRRVGRRLPHGLGGEAPTPGAPNPPPPHSIQPCPPSPGGHRAKGFRKGAEAAEPRQTVWLPKPLRDGMTKFYKTGVKNWCQMQLF